MSNNAGAMTDHIDNSEDLIDSRDVIDRIAELEADPVLDFEDRTELQALRSLAEQGSDSAPDWEYGETLIRDSYFEDYARDLAEDIGAIPDDAQWPCTCIDWEQASRKLQMDYTSVDFDGVTYWVWVR